MVSTYFPTLCSFPFFPPFFIVCALLPFHLFLHFSLFRFFSCSPFCLLFCSSPPFFHRSSLSYTSEVLGKIRAPHVQKCDVGPKTCYCSKQENDFRSKILQALKTLESHKSTDASIDHPNNCEIDPNQVCIPLLP